MTTNLSYCVWSWNPAHPRNWCWLSSKTLQAPAEPSAIFLLGKQLRWGCSQYRTALWHLEHPETYAEILFVQFCTFSTQTISTSPPRICALPCYSPSTPRKPPLHLENPHIKLLKFADKLTVRGYKAELSIMIFRPIFLLWYPITN